jgi:hypothetical protein
LRKPTISAPPFRVRPTIEARASGAMSWLTGMPETVVYETSGTMVSPWPPSTMAWMSSTEASSASARNMR